MLKKMQIDKELKTIPNQYPFYVFGLPRTRIGRLGSILGPQLN